MSEVVLHRLKYMLSPQLDLYRHIRIAEGWRASARVLDVGCGTGASTIQLIQPEWVVDGVDVDEELLKFAKSMWGHLAEFSYWNLENVDSGNSWGVMYDVIVCIEVIEHVVNPVGLLHGMASLLNPGGTMYVSTPNSNSQVRKNDDHHGMFDVDAFRMLLGGLPGARVTDYNLGDELDSPSTITPMVGVWTKGDV